MLIKKVCGWKECVKRKLNLINIRKTIYTKNIKAKDGES